MDINAFNEKLVRNDSRYDLVQYIHKVNELSNNPIDLSFMEELLSFVDKTDCCIPHTLLVKYGAFSEKNASQNVKTTLELYEMISSMDLCKHIIEYKECANCKDKIDYILLMNVHEQNKKHGGSNKIMYYLHPRVFKFILMRSKCEKKYAKYYLLLEESIKYYHDYQIMYKEYIISQKDDCINELRKEVKEQSVMIKDQNVKIDALLGYAEDAKEDITTLLDMSLQEATSSEESNIKVDKVLHDRINEPTSGNSEHLLLFKYKDSEYYVVRGALSYVKTKFRVLTNITYSKKDITTSQTDYIYLKTFSNVPNARHLYRALLSNYNIVVSGNMNTFTTNVDDITTINTIQEVFDRRLTINLNYSDKLNALNKATKKVKNIKTKTKK